MKHLIEQRYQNEQDILLKNALKKRGFTVVATASYESYYTVSKDGSSGYGATVALALAEWIERFFEAKEQEDIRTQDVIEALRLDSLAWQHLKDQQAKPFAMMEEHRANEIAALLDRGELLQYQHGGFLYLVSRNSPDHQPDAPYSICILEKETDTILYEQKYPTAQELMQQEPIDLRKFHIHHVLWA